MAFLNDNYLKLQAGYLFPEIARRVKEFCDANPDAAERVIRCGIGDVTEPLPAAAIAAMHKAVDELGHRETFRGYGHEQGYEFLRATIAQHDYRARGIEITAEEIFLSDGSKMRLRLHPRYSRPPKQDRDHRPGLSGLRRHERDGGPHRAVADPSGRYEGIIYLPCMAENGFVPEPPAAHADLVYLCFPNNPTGAVATREQLTRWVEYAQEHKAILLFDAAYEGYISDPDDSALHFRNSRRARMRDRIPQFFQNGGIHRSALWFYRLVEETSGADSGGPMLRLCIRCGIGDGARKRTASVIRCNAALKRSTARRGKQVRGLIEHYMGNARILREAASQAGLKVFGGTNAPYIWVETPPGLTSWQMFDRMLQELNVVMTPGSGFGSCGEGYFRLSAFNSRENAEEVGRRLQSLR